MKKVFFPKSSSSHRDDQHENSAAKGEKQQPAKIRQNKVDTQKTLQDKFRNSEHFFPVCDRKVTETKTISRSSVFRRSRTLSMSSMANGSSRFSEEDFTGLRNRQRFPSSHGECDCSDCHYQYRSRAIRPEKLHHTSSSASDPSSPQTSISSVSGKVLDLYMDGDHPQEKLRTKEDRLSFPTGVHSRVISENNNLFIPSHSTSRDSSRSDHQHESPRKLAKHVVEKLLRLEQFRDLNPGELCSTWPPMPANTCDKHLDEHSFPSKDNISRKDCTLKDILDEDAYHSFSLEREYSTTIFHEENGDVIDSELRRKLQDVKHKAVKLCKELSEERSYQFNTVNVSALSQMIRDLIEEERNLLLELSEHLQCRLSERAASKEEALLLKEEMSSSIMIWESEKKELQSRLQRELDRRSNEWESKLQEFELEEQRLNDRIGELTEQNVSLRREASDFCDKERDYMDKISQMEVNLKDLISENDNLQKMLSDVKDKLENVKEVQFCLERNFKEKEKENTELIKTASRFQGICSEQERTIDGLRQCLNSEIERGQTSGNIQNVTLKSQMEQLRLAQVEQVLRRQLETCTVEVESLRSENIYLLERLKGSGEISGRSGFKLDQEMDSYVHSLKNAGLSLVNESVQMCEELLGICREKEFSRGIQESHTVSQYDMKVQGFKQGLEQLTRSLGKAGFVLRDKVEPSQTDNQRFKNTNWVVEGDLVSELKAEILLTSVLKEKLYSKEKELERVQDELARASRRHDVLKSEIQDAYDTVSCLNHKMKNFELQMIEKDGTIKQLRVEMQSQEEELGSTKRTLSKVSQERDLMWEEVKQYSEKNMLLNHELNSLKKKLDALEEDTLLKDGQITILKDSLSNARPYDVLFGVDQGELFKL